MPAVKREKGVLDELRKLVIPSIVSVNTYEMSKYKLDFATGFIVYSDTRKTLICVNESVLESRKPPYVHFSDGAIEKAETFLMHTPSDHVVLKTGGPVRQAVSFRQSAAEREHVFTVAEVEGGYSGFNFMTGTICCPSCEAMDKSGRMVTGSKETFAMTCPAPQWPHEMETEDQLIGAAVFDMIDGAVVGTIKSLDETVYDLKFASQAYCWINELERLLKRKDKTVKFKKINPNKSSKVEKRKRTEKINQSQQEWDRQVV